jgi:phosphoribulokinase
VIHLRNQEKFKVDIPRFLMQIEGSFLSRPDTLVVPGVHKVAALEIIITPEIRRLIRRREIRSPAASSA